MRFLVTSILLLLLLAAGALVGIYSGAYDVAATQPPSELEAWVLATVRDRSVARRARTLDPPPLAGEGLEETGLHHYHAMCVTCHGAPGRSASEIGQGLNPAPPDLTLERVQRRTDAELFWILKHGIRMTGMPAFGPTHSDEELWALVAFLRRLRTLSPEEYEAKLEAAGVAPAETEEGHDHHHPPGHRH